MQSPNKMCSKPLNHQCFYLAFLSHLTVIITLTCCFPSSIPSINLSTLDLKRKKILKRLEINTVLGQTNISYQIFLKFSCDIFNWTIYSTLFNALFCRRRLSGINGQLLTQRFGGEKATEMESLQFLVKNVNECLKTNVQKLKKTHRRFTLVAFSL